MAPLHQDKNDRNSVAVLGSPCIFRKKMRLRCHEEKIISAQKRRELPVKLQNTGGEKSEKSIIDYAGSCRPHRPGSRSGKSLYILLRGSDLTEDGSTLFGRTEDTGDYHSKVFDVIDSKDVPENGMWVDEDGGTAFTAPYKEGLTKTYRYTASRDGAKEMGFLVKLELMKKACPCQRLLRQIVMEKLQQRV